MAGNADAEPLIGLFYVDETECESVNETVSLMERNRMPEMSTVIFEYQPSRHLNAREHKTSANQRNVPLTLHTIPCLRCKRSC